MSDDPSRTPPPDDEDQPSWAPFGPEAGEPPSEPEPEPPAFSPPRPPEWGRGEPPLRPDEPPPAAPPSPSAPPPPAAGGPAPRKPGKATAALMLGIAGLFVLPIVCSLAAIVLGVQARREIDADPALGGRGTAQAAVVLGVIGIIAFLMFIALGLPGVGGAGTGM